MELDADSFKYEILVPNIFPNLTLAINKQYPFEDRINLCQDSNMSNVVMHLLAKLLRAQELFAYDSGCNKKVLMYQSLQDNLLFSRVRLC